MLWPHIRMRPSCPRWVSMRVCVPRMWRSKPMFGWRNSWQSGPAARRPKLVRESKRAAKRALSAGCLSRIALYEFDLVAVRIFDEGDDGRAMLHRAGFASDFAAAGLDRFASLLSVLHLQSD